MKRYYLAGPMSNIPQFNFPAFDRACEVLRAAGFTIISPHENDTPAVQDAARASVDGKMDSAGKIAGETWPQILARDVILVGDETDGIIFLPDWQKSRGAKLEAFTGLLCGKEFGAFIDSPGAEPVEWVQADAIRDVLRKNMP